MTEILKSCNRFRENFFDAFRIFLFYFVSGITFLYILTSTDGEIVAGLRFSNYRYTIFPEGILTWGKKKLLLIFPGRYIYSRDYMETLTFGYNL